jgi:hypothetical protein
MIKDKTYLVKKVILLLLLAGGYPPENLLCQNMVIENKVFSSGQSHYFSPGTITSPSACPNAVLVNGTAMVDYKAVQYVHLGAGFSTSLATAGSGFFHAFTGTIPTGCPTAIITGPGVICGTGILSASSSMGGGGTITGYQWQLNGSNISGATGLTCSVSISGNYTVLVTNSLNCTVVSGIFPVTCYPALVITVTQQQNITCYGGSNGSICISVGGGTPPYSYLWSNGSTVNCISGLTAGAYSVTVTDAYSCTAWRIDTIHQPAPIYVKDSIVPASYCNGNDGAIYLQVSGGTPPYSYVWSNGATTQNIFNLMKQDYRVTVTDIGTCHPPEPTGECDGSLFYYVREMSFTGSGGSNQPNLFGYDGGFEYEDPLPHVPFTFPGNYIGYPGNIYTGVVPSQELTYADEQATGIRGWKFVGNAGTKPSGFNRIINYLKKSTNPVHGDPFEGNRYIQLFGFGNGISYNDLIVPSFSDSKFLKVSLFDAQSGGTGHPGSQFNRPYIHPADFLIKVTFFDQDGILEERGFPRLTNDPCNAQWYSCQTYEDNLPWKEDNAFTDIPPEYIGKKVSISITAWDCFDGLAIDDVGAYYCNYINIDEGDQLCFGGTNGNLSATVAPEGVCLFPGPYYYQWSNGATTPIVTGLAAGIYSVTISNSAGKSVRATTTLTSLPLFVVGSVAANQSIAYNAIPAALTGTAPTGGTLPYSFQWQVSTDNVTFSEITGATSLTYQPGALTTTTYYKMRQSSAGGCGELFTNVVTITVAPVVPAQLALSNVTVVNGQTQCFNATNVITVAGSNTVFVVQSGASATMIAGQRISILPSTTVQHGGYFHGYIAPTGPYCEPLKIAELVNVQGINNEPVPELRATASFFRLYPNPTNGSFYLELTGIEPGAVVKTELYDILGTPLRRTEQSGQLKYTFNLEGKPNGIYLLRIVSGKFSGTGRIIKQ